MGEAMALLAVFSECLPEQFLACQSINMLDGTTRRPPQAFGNLEVRQRQLIEHCIPNIASCQEQLQPFANVTELESGCG